MGILKFLQKDQKEKSRIIVPGEVNSTSARDDKSKSSAKKTFTAFLSIVVPVTIAGLFGLYQGWGTEKAKENQPLQSLATESLKLTTPTKITKTDEQEQPVPPDFEIIGITTDSSINLKSMNIKLGKKRLYPNESLPKVPSECIVFKKNNNRLAARLKTLQAIEYMAPTMTAL